MDALRPTKAKTGREALVAALADSHRRRRVAALIRYAGTCPDMVTVEELRAQRRHREKSFAESVGESLDPD